MAKTVLLASDGTTTLALEGFIAQLPVILLPGIVLPAELAYGALIAELDQARKTVAKELEVYTTPEPPEDYGLETESAGVLRLADDQGWERLHLAGYSAGGATALVFAATHPRRLASLALLEPAWAGNRARSAAEKAVWAEHDRLEGLSDEEYLPAFMRLGLRPGVPLPAPPPPEPPPWMAQRPAGIRAIQRAFERTEIDPEALGRLTAPVYLALGGLSNPDYYGEIAMRLSRVFADFELEVFEERHHFDPPHRIEPKRLARALEALWRRGEGSPPADRSG
jgi:pimeloyl-ACP methyl ester carboxylesterase